MTTSEHLLLFPDPAPLELVRALDLGGYRWTAVNNADHTMVRPDRDPWTGAIVVTGEQPEVAWSLCRSLRRQDVPMEPLLVVISGTQIDELDTRSDLFDDFLIDPFHPRELEARLRQLLWRAGRGTRPELVRYGDLELNIETYQAQIGGRPLDLTYMEYELLKYLAANPGKVFSREALLRQVWGYEYYGGARTVDVHVRRLRAKLGQEHAQLIHTVRSVGYKLGQGRWQ